MSSARLRTLTLIGLTSALLSGCSWLDSVNPFASNAPKPTPLADFTASAEFVRLWQTNVGKSGDVYVFSPAVVENSVYAAAYNGTVMRIDNGSTQWQIRLDDKLSAGVGSDGKLVVVVTTRGDAVALDAATGQERWRTPVGAEVLAPPAVNSDLVAIRASDNRVIALSPTDGSQRWTFTRTNPPLSLRNYTGLLLEGGVVIGGFPGGKLVAISQNNGGMLWELAVANPRGATELERIADVAGPPVIGRREVCAVTYQGRASCFDVTNGNTLWSREMSSHVGLDRDTRYIYITDQDDNIHALDSYSGANLWKQNALLRRTVSRPLAVDTHVVVGDAEGYLHVLNSQSGAIAARTRVDSSAITADPRLLGRGLVVQTRDGTVAAFELR